MIREKLPFRSLQQENIQSIECGRNILDQLDITYQRAFTASKTSSAVPIGHYQLSPARERYYDMQADIILEKNVGME